LHLQAKSQRDRIENVLLLLIEVELYVLEEFIFCRDFVMMFKVVDHLHKVVG